MRADALLQKVRSALADIAGSKDMTLAMARKKARRIYRETEPRLTSRRPDPRRI